MREILFRGQRADNGEWDYGYYFFQRESTTDKKTHFIVRNTGFGFAWRKVDFETVGQFTGLTDKNGKKIFEGDIVKYSDEEGYYPEEYTEFIGEIVFEKGAFGIGCREDLPIELDYWCANDNFVSLWEIYWNLNCCEYELPMLEIIGNIHDNPELLNITKMDKEPNFIEINQLEHRLAEARKETAKEILQEWADDNSSMGIDNTFVKHIAKKYGVEVEE